LVTGVLALDKMKSVRMRSAKRRQAFRPPGSFLHELRRQRAAGAARTRRSME
jgi:hypothetical protein